MGNRPENAEMIMNDEIYNLLMETLNKKNLSEEELAEWAEEFLDDYYGRLHADEECDDPFSDYDHYGFCKKIQKNRDAKIKKLKPLISGYSHDQSLPELPNKPNGSLHGIGFIYDEDNDDRILVAIDQLKNNEDIVAMSEHEGNLAIYSRLPTGLAHLEVCNDEWCVIEYVPYRGKWVELNQKFIINCVSQVLKLK